MGVIEIKDEEDEEDGNKNYYIWNSRRNRRNGWLSWWNSANLRRKLI